MAIFGLARNYILRKRLLAQFTNIYIFLFHGDWVRQHTVKGLCAARLKIYCDTALSKIDYVFHKGGIIILRKNQSIFIYQSKIAYPVPFLPLL